MRFSGVEFFFHRAWILPAINQF